MTIETAQDDALKLLRELLAQARQQQELTERSVALLADISNRLRIMGNKLEKIYPDDDYDLPDPS